MAVKFGRRPFVVPARARKVLDWKKYVIPTKWKRKKNVSERIDEILYGAGK